MLINSIQANLYPKTCQIKQFEATARNYNTNPLAYDTFTPSVSFKAAIHHYIRIGNLEGLKQELDSGTDINLRDEFGETPLLIACKKENINIVKELLDYPVIDVNAKSNDNFIPLRLACLYNHPEIVKMLVACEDINVNGVSSDNSPKTALCTALDFGYEECVREILKHPDVDLNTKYCGETMLERAQRKGNSKIVEMIKEYQPGIDRRDRVNKVSGRTGVVKNPQVDIEKLSPEENIWSREEISNEFLKLVKDGKYNKAMKMLETTPLIDLQINNRLVLRTVCKTNDIDFIEKVFDYKRNQEQMAIEYDTKRKEFLENTIKTMSYDELRTNNIILNTVDGFRLLVENREFNPNDTFGNASTTLFEQACEIDPEGNLPKEILSKYGNVNTANAAKTWKYVKVIKDLINDYEKVGKYRAVLNKIEDNAFYADERRGVAADQLKKLLESPNFTPEIADEVGNSVLHIAAALPDDMGRTLIQMALDKGVDINVGNCTGQRPLMSAIKKLVTTDDNAGKMNLMSNIKFLLDKGADVNAQDNNGQTAFHFACISTVAALLTLLLSKNPNVFLPDKYGNRAAKYIKTDEMKEIYNKYLGAL